MLCLAGKKTCIILLRHSHVASDGLTVWGGGGAFKIGDKEQDLNDVADSV